MLKVFSRKSENFFSNRFRGKSVKDEERRKLGFHFQMKRGKSMLKLRAEIFVIFHPWQKFYYPNFFGNFHLKCYHISNHFKNLFTFLFAKCPGTPKIQVWDYKEAYFLCSVLYAQINDYIKVKKDFACETNWQMIFNITHYDGCCCSDLWLSKTLSTLKEVNKRALIKECFVCIKTESTSVP